MLAARYKHIDDFQTVSGMLLVISSNLCQSFYRNGIDYNTAVTVLGINYIQHFTQIAAAAAYDRVLALDTMAVNMIALLTLFGLEHGTGMYFEASLLFAMVGFISTVAYAKFVLRGDIIE